MKVHLHAEQFDSALHATCCRVGNESAAKIVGDDEFEKTPSEKRCRYCARDYWPHGGEDRIA